MTHDTGCNQGRNDPSSHAVTRAVYAELWDGFLSGLSALLGAVVLILLAACIAGPVLYLTHFWRMA